MEGKGTRWSSTVARETGWPLSHLSLNIEQVEKGGETTSRVLDENAFNIEYFYSLQKHVSLDLARTYER